MPSISQPWLPKPQPQPQANQNLQAGMNRPQSPQTAAETITRQLQSNPAFFKQVSEKFKAESAREAQSSGGVSNVGSSYGLAEASSQEGSEVNLNSTVKRQPKAEVAPRIRRANLSALTAVENLAPALGGAAGSPEIAAEVGQAAGLKGARKGGGILGAVVAHELSFGSKGDASSSEVERTKRTPMPLKTAAVFVNNVHQAVMLGPAPPPRAPKSLDRSPDAVGQRRLTEALHQSSGPVAEFLKDSNVGRMLRAVDGLPTALAVKAAERLKTERFFLNF
jgi:hypothetical protein